MSYDTSIGGDHLDVIDSTANLPISPPFSIVAWIKCTTAEWDDAGAGDIVCFGAGTATVNNSVRIQHNQALTLRAATIDNGGSNSSAFEVKADNVYEGEWVVVVGTWDGTATTETDKWIYLQNSTDSGNNTTAETLDNTVFDSIRVGDRLHNATSNPFKGLISHVAIFDKVLTTTEVDELQTGVDTGVAPNTVAPSNCIGYWPLTTDQATHADQSGNGGPTLTVQSACPYSSDNPTITGGGVDTTIAVPMGPIR